MRIGDYTLGPEGLRVTVVRDGFHWTWALDFSDADVATLHRLLGGPHEISFNAGEVQSFYTDPEVIVGTGSIRGRGIVTNVSLSAGTAHVVGSGTLDGVELPG